MDAIIPSGHLHKNSSGLIAANALNTGQNIATFRKKAAKQEESRRCYGGFFGGDIVARRRLIRKAAIFTTQIPFQALHSC